MTTSEILTSTSTKTWKIEQLILAGLTRKEIARLVTNGNYGFVQNVYAKMKREGRLNVIAQLNFEPQPFSRRFGIEIEGYGIDRHLLAQKISAAGVACQVESYNHDTRPTWKVVTDGSLHGQNTFELVSPVLEGAEGLQQLKTVCEVLEANGAKINKSCGLHVHFDARGFELQQVKNLLSNYAAYEAEIDSFMPQSRRGNTNGYCRSLRGTLHYLQNSNSIQQLAQRYNCRYYKINLQSYRRHNTLEFRQHSGTVEFAKISNWVLFLHNLVDYSKAHTVAEGAADFESLRKFQQPEIMNYLTTRINQLAA